MIKFYKCLRIIHQSQVSSHLFLSGLSSTMSFAWLESLFFCTWFKWGFLLHPSKPSLKSFRLPPPRISSGSLVSLLFVLMVKVAFPGDTYQCFSFPTKFENRWEKWRLKYDLYDKKRLNWKLWAKAAGSLTSITSSPKLNSHTYSLADGCLGPMLPVGRQIGEDKTRRGWTPSPKFLNSSRPLPFLCLGQRKPSHEYNLHEVTLCWSLMSLLLDQYLGEWEF